MPEFRRLIAELPDDAMVKLVDGSYVPNRQPFAEDGGAGLDVAQPVDVKVLPAMPKPEPGPFTVAAAAELIAAATAGDRAELRAMTEDAARTATVTVVPAEEFPAPGRCPACGHLVVDHTSGANGTGGCAAEGCSCGNSYALAKQMASDAAAGRPTGSNPESLNASVLDPTTLLNEPNPLQKMLEQEKGAFTPGESRTYPNPLSADARDALLGVGRGAGIPLRQACETLKKTLEWVAAIAPPSEYQRWTRAFDALDRVTRHCARTSLRPPGERSSAERVTRHHATATLPAAWRRAEWIAVDVAAAQIRPGDHLLHETHATEPGLPVFEVVVGVQAAPFEGEPGIHVEYRTSASSWGVIHMKPDTRLVVLRARLTPGAVEWQRDVCRAWARAIGLAGSMASDSPTLAVPTVTQLQDATAIARAREHTRGVRMTARMWAASLGRRDKLTEAIPTPETLIEQTTALVEREREQQHAITNLSEQVAAHRARLGQAPESGSVNETGVDDDAPAR